MPRLLPSVLIPSPLMDLGDGLGPTDPAIAESLKDVIAVWVYPTVSER